MKKNNKKEYSKIVGCFLFFCVILIPNLSFAGILCSKDGYTIATINGINTDKIGAEKNMDKLTKTFGSLYNSQAIDYQYLLNPTHVDGLGDKIDVVGQKLFENDTSPDYDFIEMWNDASKKVKTEKLLLVGHSQGNFYANNFYDLLADKNGGVPKQSLGVYSVATPASHVAGGGKYLTSGSDSVINDIRIGNILNVLPANIDIKLPVGGVSNGHDFADVYLLYQGDRIRTDIESSLYKLLENNTQDKNKSCIIAPEITLGHKIDGVIISFLDHPVDTTKAGAVYIANVTYSTALAIGNITIRVTNTLASSIFSLAKSVFNNPKNLAANNPAAVILADNQTLQNSSPEPKKENPKPVIKTPVPKTEALLPSAPDINSSLDPGSPAQTPAVEIIAPPVITAETDTEIVRQDLTTKATEQDLYKDLLPGGGGVAASSYPLPDTTAPIITLTGNPTITLNLNVGDTYTESGATATDNIDNSVAVVITGTVNTSAVGTYIVHYNATDTAGNHAVEIIRTVTVNTPPDTTAPVITITGDNPKTILLGSAYTDAGATASDNVDGNITANIITVNNVNPATVGTYTVTYNVSDAAHNAATEVIRTVHVAVYTSSYLENSQSSLPGALSVGREYYCANVSSSISDTLLTFGSIFTISAGGVSLDSIGVRGVAGSGTVNSANLYVYGYNDDSNALLFGGGSPLGSLVATSDVFNPSTWSSATDTGTTPSDFPYDNITFPHVSLPVGNYFMTFGDCSVGTANYFGVKDSGSGFSQGFQGLFNYLSSGSPHWDNVGGRGFDYIINGSF